MIIFLILNIGSSKTKMIAIVIGTNWMIILSI